MGETNITSSKRKSSSLIKKKKKRSHDLHKAHKKKTKRSRSKIRKSKSKKLRRRDNSSSYSDRDDDDESSKSLSSSDSFFDDHKRKRSRSRTQIDGKKKSKKQTRKRSPSSESERDQRRRVKKGKGLKRNIDSGTKKKSRLKKHKSGANISSSRSSSSSLLSCSISGASSCEDLGRNGSKRRRYRSPSCSSIRRWSEGDDYQTENNLISENTSRRLRSVITVVKEPGVREVEMDKEEIIHERDDHPSCRSNDSDDAKMKIDEEMKGVQDYSVMRIDMNDRYEASYPSEDEYTGARQVSENKNEDFNDDELILRQRALENLIKFRREELKKKATTLDPKGQKDDAVKQSPSLMAGLLPRNEDGAKVPSTVTASQENTKPTMLKVDDRSSQHRRRSQNPELAKGKEDGRKLPITNKGVNQIGIARKLRNSISSMQEDRKLREGKYTSEGTLKNSKPNMSVLGRETQDVYSSLKQVPTSQQRPKSIVNSIADEITIPSPDIRVDSDKQVNNNVQQVPTTLQQGPKSNVNSNAAEISKLSVIIRDDSGKQVSNNASVSSVSDPSCVKPETGEQSSKDVQGETKDTSQYEQKTMSVMRGGEMVQVSYKVYIPKKTPALARRQLQR